MKKLILGATLVLSSCFVMQNNYAQSESFGEFEEFEEEELGDMAYPTITETVSSEEAVCPSQELLDEASWMYVQTQFGILLKDQIGMLNKFGTFCQNYAHVWSLPLSTASGVAGIFASDKAIDAYNREKEYDDALSKKAGTVINLASFIASSYIGFAISYKLSQMIGKWLAAKPGTSMQALQAFVSQWSTHKLQTPEALHPLFDSLSQDLSKNKKLTLVDAQKAQLLLENILATSMLASTVSTI